jgi:hypothetical protein
MAMTSKRTPPEADNFRLIKGISRSIERRLHEAGILTYGKLASLKPQAIASILGEANGVTTKRITKEEWTKQARDLSSRPSSAEPEEEAVSQETSQSVKRRGLTSFVVELLLDEEGQTKRTKVMHVDTGGEDTWNGWQERRLLDFFVAGAGLCPPATELDLPSATPDQQTIEAKMMPGGIPAHMPKRGPVPSPEAQIESRPQAIEMATSTGKPPLEEPASIPVQAEAASGVIVANQPFEVNLTLDLSEIVSPKKKPFNYKANIYAKSLKGPLHQTVGEADGQLEPTQPAIITISGNPLPQGLYRLQAVVGLSDPTSSILQAGEKMLQVA